MAEKYSNNKIDLIVRLHKRNIKEILKNSYLYYGNRGIDNRSISEFFKEIEEVPDAFLKNISKRTKRRKLQNVFQNELGLLKNQLKGHVDSSFNFVEQLELTSEEIFECIDENKHYQGSVTQYHKQEVMLEQIPENLIFLYPKARMLNRKWVLHIGPTNSGKTYQSLEKLRDVATGLYLAPLRLLALEVQEKMLENSVLCNLSTGEEEDIIEGATHCSSTVEKLDINKHYDLCVIDEAQMIEDEFRGWAWTRAILGVYADEVHVCMSENAKDIICRLIEECGEEYEIVKHERNTELIFENEQFRFPKDVRKNDALIVFSRKNVLSVASELEDKGYKVSILYGNLPYNVRKEELKKFREGQTTVLVSTDCIGIGMNVNVERIVFLQSEKFDGICQRPLKSTEVKQIAGRAGRMGMFPVGYVNALEDRRYLRMILGGVDENINFAKINFPETLLNIDDTLSNILITWSKIPNDSLFIKSDIKRDLLLCRHLEKYNFSKEQMLKFINMPFDERNNVLINMWFRMVNDFSQNRVNIDAYLKNISANTDQLDILELNHKKLDLVFSFFKAIDEKGEEAFEKIKCRKNEVAMRLIKELKKSKKSYKRCKSCGKKLPWNHPYGICQECYYGYDDDWYW